MLYTTQGIVLSYIKYRETSIIAKIFTEALGLQAYIVQGVRTKKSKYNVALFQPLTLLDMVVHHKKRGGIQRVAEIQRYTPHGDILADVKKATIAIFLAELLSKVIREEERNEKLFDFLWKALIRLHAQTDGYEFFHLTFMLQLSHYLGFGISTAQDVYTQLHRLGKTWEIDQETLEGLHVLLTGKVDKCVRMNRAVKRRVTASIIKFYQLHIDTLDTFRSMKVLQEIS